MIMRSLYLRLLVRGSCSGAIVCANKRTYSMRRLSGDGLRGLGIRGLGPWSGERFQRFSSVVPDLNLNDFHGLADSTLESILDKLIVVEESLDDVDISYAQGVLTVNLGNKGVWVINKQTPNRQLWWSSPISGPLRFEYRLHSSSDNNNASGGWYVTRENKDGSRTEIISLLTSEMLRATGKELTGGK